MLDLMVAAGHDSAEYIDSIVQSLECYEGRESTIDHVCRLSPADAPRLLKDMRAYDRSFIVRRVLEHLQMDESLAFRFRVDHKLIQGMLLQTFAPSASLAVMGLAEAIRQAPDDDVDAFLMDHFPQGYVIKDTYGYNSGRAAVLDSRASLPLREHEARNHYHAKAEEELFFVQERFEAIREYRVHSLGRDVIPTLTYRTEGSVTLMGELERRAANSFVLEMLRSLPAGLVEQSLCAWDIGLSLDNRFKIFEINYTGVHPVYEKGFHCSGNLQSYLDGTLNMARLLHFVQHRYNTSFMLAVEPTNNPLEADAASTIYGVDRWLQLLEITDGILSLWNDSYNASHSVNDVFGQIDSIRGLVYTNAGGPMERRYCEYLDWLKRMTDDLR